MSYETQYLLHNFLINLINALKIKIFLLKKKVISTLLRTANDQEAMALECVFFPESLLIQVHLSGEASWVSVHLRSAHFMPRRNLKGLCLESGLLCVRMPLIFHSVDRKLPAGARSICCRPH